MPSTAATTTPASTSPSTPTPIATIDSPSAMITISPWRSAKWLGHELPALDAEEVAARRCRAASASAHRARPAARRRRTRRRRAGRRRSRCSTARPMTERAQLRVVAARDARTARCARCARPRRRRRTAAPSRRTPRARTARATSNAAIAPNIAIRTTPLLGVDDARQPRVADPRPPQHAEHEQPLREPLPGRLVGHQRRALGQREHEDEVEEQLERRDASPRSRSVMRALRLAASIAPSMATATGVNSLAARDGRLRARHRRRAARRRDLRLRHPPRLVGGRRDRTAATSARSSCARSAPRPSWAAGRCARSPCITWAGRVRGRPRCRSRRTGTAAR